MENKQPLNKKIWEDNCKGKYKHINVVHVKSSLSNLKKRLKEEINPILFHYIYEQEARKSGWETHKNCINKSFDELPETNQEAMINTIERIRKEVIDKIFSEEIGKGLLEDKK